MPQMIENHIFPHAAHSKYTLPLSSRQTSAAIPRLSGQTRAATPEPKRLRTNLPATCSRATLPMRHSALTLMRYGSILPITVTLLTPI